MLRKQISQYKDPIKIFKEIRLKQIPYLEKISHHAFCDFIFNMELESFEKGEHIYSNGELANKLYLI